MRIRQRKSYGEFAAGLTEWMRGEDSEMAEAASEIVAEAVLVYLAQNVKE